MLRVSAGSIKCMNLSASVTSVFKTPAGTASPIGRIPSHTTKTIRSKSPSQNVGVDARIKQYHLITLSIHEPFFTAETIPKIKPSIPEIVQAVPISRRDAVNLSEIISITGLLYIFESPKSPLATALAHERNCS